MVKVNILIAIFVIMLGILYLTKIGEGHNWGDDFSMYIRHAKNIAEGIDYKNTGYIYDPLNPIGPKTCPPIFPLLLTPVYVWFGLNLLAMKVEIILFFTLSLFMIYLALRDELSSSYLVMIIAAIGFNYYFLNFVDNILSDIPFMFFMYLSLFFITKIYHSNKLWKPGILYAVLLGLLIYFAYGTRGIGILLMPSLIIYDLIKFKKITKLTIKVTILFALFAIAQNYFLHNDYIYLKTFSFNHRIILNNIMNYSSSLFFFWYNGYNKFLQAVLFSVISALAIIGYFIRVKGKITILEIFLALYVINLMIWPGPDPIRYIIPIIPLYLFYAFWAVENINLSQNRIRISFFITLILTIFVSYAGGHATKWVYGPIGESVTKKESTDLFDYIRKGTDKKDVFIFRKPRALSLFTDRRASNYYSTNNDKDLWNYFLRINATHVIVSRIFNEDSTFLVPFVRRYKDNFQNAYSNSDFVVYRIKEFPYLN